MVFTWVGIYNALGLWISTNFPNWLESIWANTVIFFLGVKLVVLTQTWYCIYLHVYVYISFVLVVVSACVREGVQFVGIYLYF